MYRHVYIHVYIHVYRPVYIDKCIDVCTDMRIDMCIDMFLGRGVNITYDDPEAYIDTFSIKVQHRCNIDAS